MANFTAADVKKLRDLTGAGMMDCKKALDEADGDFDKAVEVLRVKGAKAAQARAERTAANGLVASRRRGALVELNCETDFVAKNAEFQALADAVVDGAAGQGGRRRGAQGWPRPDGKTVSEADRGARRRRSARSSSSAASPCFDGARRDLPAQDRPTCRRRSACWSSRRATSDDARTRRRDADRRDAPEYLTRDDVPAERRRDRAARSPRRPPRGGQARAGVPKIVEGRVNGFFKDFVLLEQPFGQGQQEDGQAAARRGRRDRHALRPVRGRPGLSADGSPTDETRPHRRRPPPWQDDRDRRHDGGLLVDAAGPDDGVPPRPAEALRRGVRRRQGLGVDPDVVQRIARQIAEVVREGVQVAVVVGGGNFFRGAELQQRGMDRARADYMGMLGTVMNCLALQDFLEKARRRHPRADRHHDGPGRRAVHPAPGDPAPREGPRGHLRRRRSGMPFFSTDTVAAQRALEIGADVVLMGKTASTASTTPTRKHEPGRPKFDRCQLRRGARARPQGRRRHRVQPLHGQRPADGRLRHDGPRATSRAPSGVRRSARWSRPTS